MDVLFVVGIYTSLICLNFTVKTLSSADIYHCNKNQELLVLNILFG